MSRPRDVGRSKACHGCAAARRGWVGDSHVGFTEVTRAHSEGKPSTLLDERADQLAESGAGDNGYGARVSTESRASKGQDVELAFDTTKVVLFGANSGVNLSVPPSR